MILDVTPENISIFGSLIAFLGSVILTFSMGRVFWELRFALQAISTTIQSIVQRGDIYVFNGLEDRIKYALSASKIPTTLGLLMVASSIPIQSYSLYLSSIESNKTYALVTKAIQKCENNIQKIQNQEDRILSFKSKSEQQHAFLLYKIGESFNSLIKKDQTNEKEVVKIKRQLQDLSMQIEALHNKSL